jgi:hypothetical protein
MKTTAGHVGLKMMSCTIDLTRDGSHVLADP